MSGGFGPQCNMSWPVFLFIGQTIVMAPQRSFLPRGVPPLWALGRAWAALQRHLRVVYMYSYRAASADVPWQAPVSCSLAVSSQAGEAAWFGPLRRCSIPRSVLAAKGAANEDGSTVRSAVYGALRLWHPLSASVIPNRWLPNTGMGMESAA